MKYVIFIALAFSLASCKHEKRTAAEALAALESNKKEPTDPKKLTIPMSCDLISEQVVKEIFNVKAGTINIGEAKDPGNPVASSCFFKWDEPHVDNGGMFIQVSTNPVYDEFPEYITTYIATKLKEGEMTMGSSTPTVFKPFDAAGLPGAYSYSESRFFWNIGNDYLIMVAFNLPTYEEDQMVEAAEKVAAQVNKHFEGK